MPPTSLAAWRRERCVVPAWTLTVPSILSTPLFAPDLAQIQKWHAEFNLGRPVAVRADIWSSYREQADGGWYDVQTGAKVQ